MSREDDVAALRREFEAKLAALDSKSGLTPHESGVDITACVIAHNNWMTLPQVITSFGAQGTRVDVLTAVDASSSDPSREMLEGLARWANDTQLIRRCRFIGEIPHKDPPDQTVAHARARFANEAATEFVWYNDADVVLRPLTLVAVLDELKSAPDIGAVSVQYTFKNDHLEWGAVMMRTETAKTIGFDGRGRCGCVNLANDLKKAGLRLVDSECVAYHLKHKTVLA